MKIIGLIISVFILGMTPMNIEVPSQAQSSEADAVRTGASRAHAPEICLENPEGKELKLSDLQGKIVLVDFWASWCGPCKKSRPGVKTAYNQYKNTKFENASGFEVFSVSLDTDKARWQKAIDTYDLDWSNHVSDLKGWKSEVLGDFGVRGIPSNFLLNEKGEIVAQNIHNDELLAELKKMMK